MSLVALQCSSCGTALAPEARFCSICGTPAPVTSPNAIQRDERGIISAGTMLEDRYRIIKLLGQGGFSRVYEAEDTRLGVMCAIKENSEFDRSAYSQFIAEAQLLARLKHPNLIKVTDYFADDSSGAQFLVMEYVPGEDLEQLMNRVTEYVPWRTVAEWARVVCDVLAYLHSQDPPIIHRDIKPANLRLMPDGTLMVIDLGIAKIQKVGSATTRAAQAYSGGYSPIEQYLGQGTDARSDLYSLGATLYHLLTGKMPSEAPNRLRGITMPSLEQARPDIPVLMARALDRAMAIEPDQRPPSAAALDLVLGRVLDNGDAAPIQTHPIPHPLPVATHVPSTPRSQSQPNVITPPRVPTQPRRVISEPRAERLTNSIIWHGDQREMVIVRTGMFPMGDDDGDPDEKPATEVDLPTFLIDRFPVTCLDYSRFVQETGYHPPRYWSGQQPPSAIEDHPVVEVTLEDAREYARWAGKRLPTEAEWEKAATWNAATMQKLTYPWGNEWDENRANGREGGAGGTVPIGIYSPQGDSPWGVAEMVGNVWEWTDTAYKPYPYDVDDGREQQSSGLRVTRGGSWTCSPESLRAANRNVAIAHDADHEIGFRCAGEL